MINPVHLAGRVFLFMAGIGLTCPWVHAQESSESAPADFSSADLESLLQTPVVESSSRRIQSLHEAASAVSVITAEEIAGSGANNLAELLRLVPGVFVLQNAANAYNVGLRGLNPQMNNRVLILLDGRQVIERLTGLQTWGAMPVHPADIERIEVIRGPGSTLYGSDAMSGVINIVTKRPLAYPGGEAQAWGQIDYIRDDGTPGEDPVWLSNAGGSQAAYSWISADSTVGVRVGLNLNHQPEWPGTPQSASIRGPSHYGLSAALDLVPADDWTIYANLSHTVSEHSTVVVPGTLANLSAFSELAGILELEKKRLFTDWLDLRVHVDARNLREDFRSQEKVDSDYFRQSASGLYSSVQVHGLLQLDASWFSGRNVLTLGTEATYFGVTDFFTKPEFVFVGVVANDEIRLLADGSLVLHLGGRFEQTIAREDLFGEVVHRHLSPRGALIWRLDADQSLRLAVSTSFRTPNTFESFMFVDMQLSDPPLPRHRFLVGNPYLRPEELLSAELGYRGKLGDLVRVDAVVFAQAVDGLIGQVEQNIMPMQMDNVADLEQLGFEASLRFVPSRDLTTYLLYTFTYSRDATTSEQVKDFPVHLVGLGGEARLPWNLRLNLNASMVFDYRPTLSFLTGLDTNTPNFEWRSIQAADQVVLDVRLGRLFAQDRAEFFLSARNLQGLFRDFDGLRMAPHPNIQPIGTTLMAGVALRGF